MKRYQKLFSIFMLALIVISVLSSCSKASEKLGFEDKKKTISKYADIENIDEESLFAVVNELASEKYMGRLTGTKENEDAAEYIASMFRKIGLESPESLNNYMQYYRTQVLIINEEPTMQLEDKDGNVVKSFKYQENFMFWALTNRADIDIKAPLYEVDNYEDIEGLSSALKDKVVLLPNNEINSKSTVSKKISAITEAGSLAGILEYDIKSPQREHMSLVAIPMRGIWMTGQYNPFITVDNDTYKELNDNAGRELVLHIKCNFSADFNKKVSNVVGVIPGSNPVLKDEYVIIGAHFDHVGDNKNGTYNPGALDNASGIAGLLEIARMIKKSDTPPQKTIVFIAFNGEEAGLTGSLHYADNPVFPLDKAVMINMDMIGCSADIPLSIATSEVDGNELQEQLIKCAEELGVDYKSSVIGRSDHDSFYQKGVKSVCLINEDWLNGYHSPYDTLEDVDFKKMKQVVQLVLHYIDKSVNGGEDIGMFSDKIKDGDFTQDQKISLSTFKKIDDYPVYIMNYYGDYGFSDYLKRGKQLKSDTGTSYIGDEEKIYDACSCIAALNYEGEKLLGRNLDYYPSPKLVLYTDPPDGYASISVLDLRHIGFFTEEDIENITAEDLQKLLYTPYIPLDGMNEYGLAIGEMTAYGSIAPTDPEKITLGDVAAMRLVLDRAKTVDEAVELLGKYNIYFPPAPPMHFLICDKTGKSVIIEYVKGEMVVIPSEEPWQVSTNFIIHESSEATKNACRRYSTAQRVMSEKNGKLSEKEMMNLLEEVSQFSTCYSAVFNTSTGMTSLSIGRKYGDEDIKYFELEMK